MAKGTYLITIRGTQTMTERQDYTEQYCVEADSEEEARENWSDGVRVGDREFGDTNYLDSEDNGDEEIDEVVCEVEPIQEDEDNEDTENTTPQPDNKPVPPGTMI